jgi:hypothetical protein
VELDLRRELISRTVPGKTFADVGGLWGTVNEQVTVAAHAGATATTMIDIASDSGEEGNLWQLFRERAGSHGVTGTREVLGSIDDQATVERAGRFDVVHCGGVLYHAPNPLHTLRQLRTITRETLILGTATVPEAIDRPTGSVNTAPGSALFVPAMTHTQRVVLGDWLREVGALQAIGVNHPIEGGWDVQDYGAWWWFFTRDYVAAMLSVAGFSVRNVVDYWSGRASLFHAVATESPPMA